MKETPLSKLIFKQTAQHLEMIMNKEIPLSKLFVKQVVKHGEMITLAFNAVAAAYELEALVEESSKWLNDSTLWESDTYLGPKWQAWRDKMSAINAELNKPQEG